MDVVSYCHSKKEKSVQCNSALTFFVLQHFQSLLKFLGDIALFLASFFYIMSLKIAVSEMIQLIHKLL